MSGSPIIHSTMNLLPDPNHTSVKLSHQVVRRPDDLGCVASKLTTLQNPKMHTVFKRLSFDKCFFISASFNNRCHEIKLALKVKTLLIEQKFCSTGYEK